MATRSYQRSARTAPVALLTAGKRRVVDRFARVYDAHVEAVRRVSDNPRAAFIVSDGDPDTEFTVEAHNA